MTNPQHRRFLSEVGADLAVFATRSEVLRVQEELAHHLEEKKYILIDQGLSDELAEEKSITDFGPRRQIVKDARVALSGPFRRLNAASLLAASSFFLAFPLQFLAVKGFYSLLLGVLFALAAFYFAVTGVEFGARITLARTIMLGLVSGASFLVPFNEIIVGGASESQIGQAATEFLIITKKAVSSVIEYRGPKGRAVVVSPGAAGNVAVIELSDQQAKKGSPPLPSEYVELLKSVPPESTEVPRGPIRPPEASIAVAWVLSSLLIALAAAAASWIGERIRASKDQRTHVPPPMPISAEAD